MDLYVLYSELYKYTRTGCNNILFTDSFSSSSSFFLFLPRERERERSDPLNAMAFYSGVFQKKKFRARRNVSKEAKPIKKILGGQVGLTLEYP